MASSRPPYTLINLANAFLAGPWTLRSLMSRGVRACPPIRYDVRRIVTRLLNSHGPAAPPSFDSLLSSLLADPWIEANRRHLLMGQCFWAAAEMAPRGTAARSWEVPQVSTAGQLAQWLDLSLEHLDWLAD